MYSSIEGRANDWHLVHLGSRAVGGFGLVIAEATAVEARGRISPDDAGLWEDGQIAGWARAAGFIKKHGAVPGIQLAHAGRKASTARPWGHPRPHKPLSDEEGGWDTVAPSPIAFDAGGRVPEELSVEAIGALVQKFADAARRALSAGYELIELHGAHGYLINEFLSPLTNHRGDNYGGSFGHRARFLLEIIAAVRNVWPERFPLFVRLSCSDWADGGWTIDDSVALAPLLKEAGVDLVDCSSGGVVAGAKVSIGPGYQVPFSDAVRNRGGIMTAAVGLITQAKQAAAIIDEGKADIVLLAREALRNPYFPIHAAKELGAAIAVPGQYGRA